MGVNAPRYTEAELEEMRQANEKGATVYTMYEAAGLREQWKRTEAAGFGRGQAAAVNSTAEDVFENPLRDLEKKSRKVHKALDEHCARKSKWSGTTLVRPRAEMVGVNGRKAWNCDIVLREDAGVKTVVHGHLTQGL
jgi:hypothetical protein